jgi:hypothetical protein
VPRDLSIVGFDGIKVGQLVEPSLATIETVPRALGAGASQTILSMINGSAPPEEPLEEKKIQFPRRGQPYAFGCRKRRRWKGYCLPAVKLPDPSKS